MRDFLKCIHDYPDEITGIACVIILIVWMICMYKLYKD